MKVGQKFRAVGICFSKHCSVAWISIVNSWKLCQHSSRCRNVSWSLNFTILCVF